jgi:hypothetical protein
MIDLSGVAVTPRWTRSTFCADNACVEAAPLGGDKVGVRDSKDPERPPLVLHRDHWLGFLAAVRQGDYQDL